MPNLLAILLLLAAGERPAAPSKAERSYLGEYGTGPARVIVLEDAQRLYAVRGKAEEVLLVPAGQDRFRASGSTWIFARDGSGSVSKLEIDSVSVPKVRFPEDGSAFRIQPLRPVEGLRAQAIRQMPPVEKGPFRKPDLVSVRTVDPSIHLDIRYATSNNFMGAPMYTEARAFLERPAAEALGRAASDLKQKGFGLLIHDAYRPWYVTWMFWEATPAPQRIFVANPAEGSKHNRGCAVDLGMYSLADGKLVSMPSVYDEMTDRAYSNYPGGSSLQRWNRSVLRDAMEKQGFKVIPTEWWHFDFRDWKQYPIGNVRFEDLKQ